MKKQAKKVTLIAPPCIDWSMPLLACALLKACLSSKYDVNVIDLNLEYFTYIWGKEKIANGKAGINKCIAEFNLKDSVKELIKMIGMVTYHNLGNGEHVLMRKTHTIDKWYQSSDVNELLEKGSRTEDVIRHLIDGARENYEKSIAFCISISVEDQIVPSFILMKILRSYFPHTNIVIGGNIASRLSNQLINSSLKSLFDFLVIGEGEESLLRLIQHIETDNKRLMVPQIITSNKSKIDYTHIKMPDFSWCDFSHYLSVKPILPITINRKCDWARCEFCAIHSCWDDRHRIRDMDHIIRDIKYYVERLGIKYFRIVDENVSPFLLERFANLLLENKINIFYEAYVRFDKEFSNAYLAEKIYKSGCRQLFWGIESFDDEVLQTIKKGTTTDIISSNLSTFARSGVLNYCFVLTGIPNIPIGSEKATMQYVARNKDIHVVAIGSYVVDRLSPMHILPELHTKYCISLYEKGDLTTEIGFLYKGEDIGNSVRQRTQQYIEELYSQRGDYALSAMMDEETRFILCSVFGNDFAQKAHSMLEYDLQRRIYDLATNRSTEERVVRGGEQ